MLVQPPGVPIAAPCTEITPPTMYEAQGIVAMRRLPGMITVSVAPNAQGEGGHIGIGPAGTPMTKNEGPDAPPRSYWMVAFGPGPCAPFAVVMVRPPQPVAREVKPAPGR